MKKLIRNLTREIETCIQMDMRNVADLLKIRLKHVLAMRRK